MMATDSSNTPKSSDQGGEPALSAALAAALQESRPDATQEGPGQDKSASSGQDSDEIEIESFRYGLARSGRNRCKQPDTVSCDDVLE